MKTYKNIIVLCLLLGTTTGGRLNLDLVYAAEGNISDTDKYAWSEHAGWLNFRPTHGGASVHSDHLEGYIWAENIGWIRLGSYSGGGSHTYSNNSTAADWGVNHDGAGNLSGYAWSENAGWINFNPTHSQVTIDLATGLFDGYAWGENIGWVHFRNSTPAYGVRTLMESQHSYLLWTIEPPPQSDSYLLWTK